MTFNFERRCELVPLLEPEKIRGFILFESSDQSKMVDLSSGLLTTK